jgi:hypothetical protein
MNVIIQRNPMKPAEFCIKLLGVYARNGHTLIRPAYTAGIGYLTRDEAIQALERNTWMDNRAMWPAKLGAPTRAQLQELCSSPESPFKIVDTQ